MKASDKKTVTTEQAATNAPAETLTNVSTEQAPAETKAPEVPREKTINELRAEAKNAAIAALDENPDLSDEQRLALQLAAYKASKAVIDKVNADKAAEKLKEIEAAKQARTADIDQLIALYVANQAAANDDKLSIDEKNVANNAYQSHMQHVKDEYVKGMQRTIVIPQGMSGKTLEKKLNGAPEAGGTGKGAQVMELLQAGKTKDELEAMGFADGTIRSAIWKLNKAKKAGA